MQRHLVMLVNVYTILPNNCSYNGIHIGEITNRERTKRNENIIERSRNKTITLCRNVWEGKRRKRKN